MNAHDQMSGKENLDTLKADLDRLKDEVSTLLSDTIKVPRNAVLGDLIAATRRQPLRYLAYAAGAGFIIGRLTR